MIEKLEWTIGEVNVNLYEVFASVFHPLRKSYILDSGSSTYIMKDKHRLFKYKQAPPENKLKYRRGYIVIQGYKDLDIQFISQGIKKPRTLQLFRVVYCPDFPFNIVFFQQLEKRGIDWSHRYRICITSEDIESLKRTKKMHRQYVLKYRPVSKTYTATIITAEVRKPSKRPSGRQLKDVKASA